MIQQQILLVCYSFPPHPGIGGRRWAKFSKKLSCNGYTIHVFNAKNISITSSLWNHDVMNSSTIKINSYLFNFQKLIFNPKSYLQKIIRKIFVKLLRLTKYTPDIITSFPNTAFWNGIEQTIKENNIKTLIVSGDPYLFYQATLLKKKNKIDVILDYRDLWNDHSFYQNHISLSKKQKHYFEFCENYAVNHCDKILTVDKGLEHIIKQRIKSKEVPTYILHNGFDPNDFNDVNEKILITDKINILFAGNISSDVNFIFIAFFNALKKLKELNNSLFNLITIELIGNMDFQLHEYISNLNLENTIIKQKTLPFNEYKKLSSHKNAGLIHLSKEYPHSYATKFSDYLKLNLFTISIGYKGDFANFIESNKIGVHFNIEEDDVMFFEKLYTLFKTRLKPTNEILNKFNIDDISKELIKIIENDA